VPPLHPAQLRNDVSRPQAHPTDTISKNTAVEQHMSEDAGQSASESKHLRFFVERERCGCPILSPELWQKGEGVELAAGC